MIIPIISDFINLDWMENVIVQMFSVPGFVVSGATFLVPVSRVISAWWCVMVYPLGTDAAKILYYSEERKRAMDGSMCRRFTPTPLRMGGWMYGSVGVRWLVGIDGWALLISSIFWQVYPKRNGNVTPFQWVLMVFASLIFALTAVWLLWLTGTATHSTAQVTFLKVKSMIKVIKLSDKLMSEGQILCADSRWMDDKGLWDWEPGWRNDGTPTVLILGDGKIDVGEWSDARRVRVRQGTEGLC